MSDRKRAAIFDGGSRHVFRVGQRVRPSQYGIDKGVFNGSYRGALNADQSGIIVSVDEFGCPTIRWGGKKTPCSYYYGFITIDRRRRSR